MPRVRVELPKSVFDPDCRLCPRLAAHLDEVREEHPGYWNRPVGPFGDAKARMLIVGLAPGKHGANRTGRPFTGDFAGILLYKTLYEFGFSNKPQGISPDDGLRLIDARITNSVKCLPPENKPLPIEVRTCNRYLRSELATLPQPVVIVALGRVGHEAVLRAYGLPQRDYPFGHGAQHVLPSGIHLIDSYHCSRYNTQTGRLTESGFREVFAAARRILGPPRSS